MTTSYNTHPTVAYRDPWSYSQQNLYVKGNFDHIAETRALVLALMDAQVPSTIAAAARDFITNSGDVPVPIRPVLRFDKDTDEGRQWTISVPRDYGGSPVIRALCHMDSLNTSANVVFYARVGVLSVGNTDGESFAFDTANSTTLSVPNAADTAFELTTTLTNNDNMIAGDLLTLLLVRDANHGSDGATCDTIIDSIELQYSLVSS